MFFCFLFSLVSSVLFQKMSSAVLSQFIDRLASSPSALTHVELEEWSRSAMSEANDIKQMVIQAVSLTGSNSVDAAAARKRAHELKDTLVRE
jgi:hypothetical protein